MSWKSFACLAALSAMVAPAAAQPSLSVDLARNGGSPNLAVLDSNGDWQWEVVISADAAGSLAAELEATFSDSTVTGASITASEFDTPNPSPTTLPWVVRTGEIVGLQFDASANEAVIGFGSDATIAPGTDYVIATFTTEGPSTTGSLTSSISVAGNVAQLGVNNPGLLAAGTATALAGDANLDGTVNFQDAGILSGAFNSSGAIWSGGDFNGDGNVNFQDAGVLSGNFNTSGTAPASVVPEPTAALLALGGLACFYSRRR